MALLFSHKVDPRRPISSMGLAYECFMLEEDGKSYAYYVAEGCHSVAKPTREIRRRFKAATALLDKYRTAAIQNSLHPCALSRLNVMNFYHKILCVLNGEDEPAETPYRVSFK